MNERLAAEKVSLRSSFRKDLSLMAPHQVEELGVRVQDRVIASPIFQGANTLALYHPYQNEVRTDRLFEQAKKDGKRLVYPSTPSQESTLDFYDVDSLSELTPSTRGPWGPKPLKGQDPVPYDSIDLMVVPGLAFDRKGGRLGRGKGFYDRTLKQFSGVKLGVAYAFQVLESVPWDSHDEPVQFVATESELFHVS